MSSACGWLLKACQVHWQHQSSFWMLEWLDLNFQCESKIAGCQTRMSSCPTLTQLCTVKTLISAKTGWGLPWTYFSCFCCPLLYIILDALKHDQHLVFCPNDGWKKWKTIPQTTHQCDSKKKCKKGAQNMGVSKNRVFLVFTPQIIHFSRVFPYFHTPFWGVKNPLFLVQHPYAFR